MYKEMEEWSMEEKKEAYRQILDSFRLEWQNDNGWSNDLDYVCSADDMTWGWIGAMFFAVTVCTTIGLPSFMNLYRI